MDTVAAIAFIALCVFLYINRPRNPDPPDEADMSW